MRIDEGSSQKSKAVSLSFSKTFFFAFYRSMGNDSVQSKSYRHDSTIETQRVLKTILFYYSYQFTTLHYTK